MYQAILNNQIISSVEFNHKYPDYKETNTFAACPSCHTNLWLIASSSVARNLHFRHKKDIECPWSKNNTNLCFEKTNDGIKFKEEFCTKENIVSTFIILKNIVGKFTITHDLYLEILQNLDHRNIWSYTNLTIELLPYVMLSTHIFKSINGVKTPKNGDRVSFIKHKNTKGFNAKNINITQRKNNNRNNGKLNCPKCHNSVYPRLITYKGDADKSLCPICGATIKNFGKTSWSPLVILASLFGLS
jgi:uncharacterized protein YbaR (Trm112 family)